MIDNLNPLKTSQLDVDIEIDETIIVNNAFHRWSGIGIHAANKLKHTVQGYRSARGFSSQELDRAVQYDYRVVKRWLDYLGEYKSGFEGFRNRNILELGPGADLGIGLISLAEGASSYRAVDVHNLIKSAPEELYGRLFESFSKYGYELSTVEAVKAEFESWKTKKSEILKYDCKPDFDLTYIKENSVDMVVSNSAIQQFIDPNKTFGQLNNIVRSGGQFVGLIDLKTHTRWINQRDPLNIYRYSDSLYKVLSFKGIQNRWRPIELKTALENNGWKDVKVFPRIILSQDYVEKVRPSLLSRFDHDNQQMEILAAVICATKQ